MLNVRNYLEEFHQVICANSTARLKMFAYRYQADDPSLQQLLALDRVTLKLYLFYLKKDVLPLIEEHLGYLSDDPLH